MAIGISVESVTPEQATQWLEAASGREPNLKPLNRPVQRAVVARYARDMEGGRWALNGETIVIDEDGLLRQGQHRCHACIKANVPFETVVVRGVGRESFDTMDTGIKRSAKDVLVLRGTSDAGGVAAVSRWIWKVERGPLFSATVEPSTREIEDTVARHSTAIHHHVAQARAVGGLLPVGVAGALHWQLTQRDPQLADLFFDALATGERLSGTEPVYVLRETLLRNRGTLRRLPSRVLYMYAVKAWNATRSGRTVKRLSHHIGDEMPEVL